jgi:polysaccharide deacetylase 2 family uncharacterized protein YibQ
MKNNSPGISLMGENYKLWIRVLDDRHGNPKIASSLSTAIESAEETGEGLIVGAAPHEKACVMRHAAALSIDLEKRGVKFVE